MRNSCLMRDRQFECAKNHPLASEKISGKRGCVERPQIIRQAPGGIPVFDISSGVRAELISHVFIAGHLQKRFYKLLRSFGLR